MTLEIHRLTDHLGAEVRGLDLSKPLDDAAFAELHRAFLDHQVLVLRDQDLDLRRQIALSRRFGPLEDFPEEAEQAPESSKIFRTANVDHDGKLLPANHPMSGYIRITEYWHTDSSYRKLPSLCSLLYAVELPPAGAEGGQTEYADMYGAYERLPDPLKRRIAGRRCLHNYAITRVIVPELPPVTAEEHAALPPVEHPMVRVHPETGRRSLYVSGLVPQVVGMSNEEGVALVKELLDAATRPELVYRHEWRLGDLVIWDNRCTIHRLVPYDRARYRRIMNRTCVAGSGPVIGPDPAVAAGAA